MFTGKDLYWSLFLIGLQGSGAAELLEGDSNRGILITAILKGICERLLRGHFVGAGAMVLGCLQSFAGYLGRTPVFVWDTALRGGGRGLNSSFSGDFY